MTASQKIKKACHFERQREIFLLHYWVLNVINLKAGQCLSVARRAGSYGSQGPCNRRSQPCGGPAFQNSCGTRVRDEQHSRSCR